MKDREILGLTEGSQGRSCTSHRVCGKHLRENDLLKLKKAVVEFESGLVKLLKVVKIQDGVETCTVGFLNSKEDDWDKLDIEFAQVTELYEDSENSYKRKKSKRLTGMAAIVLLNTIPSFE